MVALGERTKLVASWLAAWWLLLVPFCAFAVNYSGVDAFEEYGKHVHAAQEVSPLSDALFGDQVSLYNGATSFDITDFSLPGNNALPVAVSRQLVIQDRRQQPADGDGLPGFGDWNLDVPYIDGTFTAQNGWTLYPSGATDRCSDNTHWPDTQEPIPGGPGYAPYEEVWDGSSLHIPGEGDQVLLANTQSKSPAHASAGTYKWVTSGNWKLSCIGSVTNMTGEGFVAVSPSGVSYTFNYAVSMPTSSFAWQYNATVGPYMVGRVRIYLLATHVQDRFGNWVNYSYSGNHLTSLTSSDGRSITLSWSGNTISSVVSSLGTWTYAYGTASHTDPNGVVETWTYLSSVTRPDGSKWTYTVDSGSLITDKNDWPADDMHPTEHCQIQPLQNTGSFVYTISAPSGATGTFTFNYLRHFRDDVPSACVNDPDPNTNYPQNVTGFFDNFALASKQISVPGLVTQAWSYDYTGIANAGYYVASTPWNMNSTAEPYIPPGDCGCTTTKTITVTGPVSIT